MTPVLSPVGVPEHLTGLADRRPRPTAPDTGVVGAAPDRHLPGRGRRRPADRRPPGRRPADPGVEPEAARPRRRRSTELGPDATLHHVGRGRGRADRTGVVARRPLARRRRRPDAARRRYARRSDSHGRGPHVARGPRRPGRRRRRHAGRGPGRGRRHPLRQRSAPSRRWPSRYIAQNQVGPAVARCRSNDGFPSFPVDGRPGRARARVRRPAGATPPQAFADLLARAQGVRSWAGAGDRHRAGGGAERGLGRVRAASASIVGQMLTGQRQQDRRAAAKEIGCRPGGPGTTAAGAERRRGDPAADAGSTSRAAYVGRRLRPRPRQPGHVPAARRGRWRPAGPGRRDRRRPGRRRRDAARCRAGSRHRGRGHASGPRPARSTRSRALAGLVDVPDGRRRSPSPTSPTSDVSRARTATRAASRVRSGPRRATPSRPALAAVGPRPRSPAADGADRCPCSRSGTVLFPRCSLPLHVFEPRYRALVDDCLAGDGEFGVVLIERGSEVGGGDVRTDVGTVAQIVEASELPDGRWALAAVGTRRIRVTRVAAGRPVPAGRGRGLGRPDARAATRPPSWTTIDAALRRARGAARRARRAGGAARRRAGRRPGLGRFQIGAARPARPARPAAGPAGGDRRGLMRCSPLLVSERADPSGAWNCSGARARRRRKVTAWPSRRGAHTWRASRPGAKSSDRYRARSSPTPSRRRSTRSRASGATSASAPAARCSRHRPALIAPRRAPRPPDRDRHARSPATGPGSPYVIALVAWPPAGDHRACP